MSESERIRADATEAKIEAEQAIAPFRARNERAKARPDCPVPPWEGISQWHDELKGGE